jgi:hypothetical protein
MFNNEGNAVHKFAVSVHPSVSLYGGFGEVTVCNLISQRIFELKITLEKSNSWVTYQGNIM